MYRSQDKVFHQQYHILKFANDFRLGMLHRSIKIPYMSLAKCLKKLVCWLYAISFNKLTAPSAPPDNLRVTSVGTDYISYSWEQPPCGHRNGVIREYAYSILSGGEGIVNGNSVMIYPLDPCTQYTFAVSAVTSMGAGPQGSVSEITGPEGKSVCSLKIRRFQVIRWFYFMLFVY